jgi:hypothetical protein
MDRIVITKTGGNALSNEVFAVLSESAVIRTLIDTKIDVKIIRPLRSFLVISSPLLLMHGFNTLL